jgi:hypothetical protein
MATAETETMASAVSVRTTFIETMVSNPRFRANGPNGLRKGLPPRTTLHHSSATRGPGGMVQVQTATFDDVKKKLDSLPNEFKYGINATSPATDAELDAIEARVGVKFPAELRKLLRT